MFLEGFIDEPRTENAVYFIGQQISPDTFKIYESDPRNTTYAAALVPEQQFLSFTDEFTARMGSNAIGSIFPDPGINYSGVSDITGSIFPLNSRMRWWEDRDPVGIGIAR